MYLVYSQNPAGSHVSSVLIISPSFLIRFPSFWFHSCRLHHLSIAGCISHCQLSSWVSYNSFSAIAGPMWPERPIRQSAFPRFQSRSAPPQWTPQLLVPLLAYSGDWVHQCYRCKNVDQFGGLPSRKKPIIRFSHQTICCPDGVQMCVEVVCILCKPCM